MNTCISRSFICKSIVTGSAFAGSAGVKAACLFHKDRQGNVFSLSAARTLLAAGLLISLSTLCPPSAAAAPPWFEKPYSYIVLDQDVRVALTEFGRNLGLPVVLSDAVSGRVRGRIEASSAGEFIERLASAHGLTWYFDGAVLNVSADKEFVTRVVDAGRLKGELVAKEMRDLGFADARFSIKTAHDGRVIRVSGPPAYIDVVEQLVERMQPKALVVADDHRVRVIRGGILTEVFTSGDAN